MFSWNSKNPIIDLSRIHRIVVRCPNWLGDAVMATSMLSELRRLLPHTHIIGAAYPAISSLYQESNLFDEFITYERKEMKSKKFVESLKKHQIDVGLLLTRSFSSAWSFFQAKIPIRIGFTGHWRSWLLTDSVQQASYQKLGIDEYHDVETYRLLLTRIGKADITSAPPPIALQVNAEEKVKIVDRLKEQYFPHLSSADKLIVINPGAAYGSAKCWSIKNFRQLVCRLNKIKIYKVVIIGNSDSSQIAQNLVDPACPRVASLVGKTSIRELMSLIAVSDIVVTNDSGPMHIASALNIPLVALFGSTNPKRTGPYNGGNVIYKAAACSPCYRRVCPIDLRCMTSISVDEVFENIRNILSHG